jgi:hypothetical protein
VCDEADGRSLARFNGRENDCRCALNSVQRLRQTLTVAVVQMQIVTARLSGVESDGFADDEGHGLRFKFARVTRGRAVVSTMEQTVCVLVGEHEEGLCGRETVQDLNAFACRGPERAAKVIGRLDRDPLCTDGGTEGVRLPARIARRDRDLGQRLAVR